MFPTPAGSPPRILSASASAGSLLPPASRGSLKPTSTGSALFPTLTQQQQSAVSYATAPTTPASVSSVSSSSGGRSLCGECEATPPSLYCPACAAMLCVPCSSAVHTSRIHRSHALVPLPVPSCSECTLPAANYCADCDCGSGANLCTEHSRTVHGFRVSRRHRLMPLSEKAAFINGRSLVSAGVGAYGSLPSTASASASSSASRASSRSATRTPSTSLPGSHLSLKPMRSRILTDNTHAPTLQRFLEGIPLPTRCLYRATRDGFGYKDWQAKCIGQGPTMTLVKVKGSGFIFGAYTACAWPVPSPSPSSSSSSSSGGGGGDDADTPALDPSGSSFLFSLTNSLSHPLRFHLASPHACACATRLDEGPRFGGVEDLNIVLMNGTSADREQGNGEFGADGEKSYRVDEDMERRAGGGAEMDSAWPFGAEGECEVGFISGNPNGMFACAEVEVYGM